MKYVEALGVDGSHDGVGSGAGLRPTELEGGGLKIGYERGQMLFLNQNLYI